MKRLVINFCFYEGQWLHLYRDAKGQSMLTDADLNSPLWLSILKGLL